MASIAENPYKNRGILPCSNRQDEQVAPQYNGATINHQDRYDEMKQTEDLLASELKKLSFQERSAALDDLHCVGEELKETTEMIQQSLVEFERVVQVEKNNLYELACQQNRSYVEDPSFRLKFLRANFHNVGLSVRQMMEFLRYKATYFGNDTLARDITLDDLNEEDLELMLSGLYHVQDGRDRNGRVIVYLNNHMLGRCRAETCIRVAYYIWYNVMISLPEVQIKGLVSVYYDVSKPQERVPMPGANFLMTTLGFTASLPMRYSAMHICLKTGTGNLGLNNAILGFSLKRFPQYARVRTLIHYGSDIELQYHLRSHGFPTDTCPLDADGNFREDILNAWFYKQRDKEFEDKLLAEANGVFAIGEEEDSRAFSVESSEDEYDLNANGQGRSPSRIHGFIDAGHPTDNTGAHQEDIVDYNQAPTQPTEKDVLLGRGKRIQNHPGNIAFRCFLANYSDDYDEARRKKRPQLCAHLVLVLRAKGVRFWQENEPDVWVESDAKEAEKKIGQLFRSIRKQKK